MHRETKLRCSMRCVLYSSREQRCRLSLPSSCKTLPRELYSPRSAKHMDEHVALRVSQSIPQPSTCCMCSASCWSPARLTIFFPSAAETSDSACYTFSYNIPFEVEGGGRQRCFQSSWQPNPPGDSSQPFHRGIAQGVKISTTAHETSTRPYLLASFFSLHTWSHV